MAVTRRQRALSGTRLTPQNNNIGQRRRGWTKRYRPNDHAKRHRLGDRQPKAQRVAGYTRRT